jgi:uncharacterized delta-60 repeat protein
MCRPSGAIIASLVAVSAVWSVAALADCTLPSTPNDGYFDQTWAGNGCITFNVDNRNAAATGALQKIVVTGNDNLLVGGDSSSGSGSWWIGELTAQGAFDTTFGDSDASGRITECQLFLPGTCPSDIPEFDYLAQPDGKVLVLSDHYLARTNVGGHAFDTAGVTGGLGYATAQFQVATPYGVMYGTSGGGLALTSGGKIFIGGYGDESEIAAYWLGGIARVNAGLSLDTTFHAATENAITYTGGAFVDTGDYTKDRQVLIQSTGRIVLVGTKYGQDFRISRLNADGSPDASFGTNGTTILSPAPSPCAPSYWNYIPPRPATLDRADRIVLTGECYATNHNVTLVTRLTAGGQLDMDFGSNGYYVNAAFTACPNLSVQPRALAIDSAGRILVGGTCDGEIGVERLRGNGTLDTTFGISGLAHGRFDPTSVIDEVDSIVFDRSGHPVIGGRSQPAGMEQAGVARLTYDLIFVHDFEAAPRGCLPPDCN